MKGGLAKAIDGFGSPFASSSSKIVKTSPQLLPVPAPRSSPPPPRFWNTTTDVAPCLTVIMRSPTLPWASRTRTSTSATGPAFAGSVIGGESSVPLSGISAVMAPLE